MSTLKILVTGGGSSGHISPALAIIQTIKELAAQPGCTWTPQFCYIGGKQGLEKEQVEAVGIQFIGVETGKLRRYFSVQNFTDVLRIPVGLAQSLGAVRGFAPDVILSTGGYVSVPPVIAGWMSRVPIVIHEQTVQVGLANHITSRFATKIALSFESALSELPEKLRHKAFVAGNPVRPAIFGGEADEAVRLCGFDESDGLPTIYVTGGSQGARILNRAVEAALAELLQVCRVVHQCGRQPAGSEQDFDRLAYSAAQLPDELKRRYYYTRFVGEEIKHIFALTDLVVGRAGAGTVTELCTLGKPAIYVPLVPTGGDEQNRNARMCADVGAAVIIPQSELNGERLLQEVRTLIADSARLKAMGEAASTLVRPDAAKTMAKTVIALAQGK